MPVPNHIKVVIRGVFKTTPEEWSWSMKFGSNVTFGPDVTAEDVDLAAVESALHTFMDGSLFSRPVMATEIRAYRIGTNGRMEGNPNLRVIPTTGAPTGTGSNYYPPNVSCCVTTEAENRGPGRYGRFYLPGPGSALTEDLRLTAAGATNILNGAVAFCKSVSDAIDVPASLSSKDMVNISAVGGGSSQVVKRLRVGRTLDTIERRRRSMLEEPVSSGTIDW